MDKMSGSAHREVLEELPVTFNPPLYLERRGWVLEILRREGVTQVLDVGCGEGELISCLCNPAPWLTSSPPSILPPSTLTGVFKSEYMDCTHSEHSSTPVHTNSETDDFLHVASVHGLDISPSDLEDAIEATTPSSLELEGSWTAQMRWEPLHTKIWQGGLEIYNPELIDIECIVATEVIEHLPEAVLHKFALMLLGLYHPRLFLVTTPSYTFNARFTPPDPPPGTRKGFPDPTGRTDRIFRHHDHKFEWTVQEFTEWCQDVAEQWDYDVEIGGVGKPQEEDPWGRDEGLGFASQTAAFRRKEDPEYAQRRAERCDSIGLLQPISDSSRHVLLAEHHHLPHSTARKPAPLLDITEAVQKKMTDFQVGTIPFRELWFESDISTLCGGWVEVLVAAVNQHEGLVLARTETERGSIWEVHFPGFTPRPSSPPSSDQGLEESNAGHIETEDDADWSDTWTAEAVVNQAWEQHSDTVEWPVIKEDWGSSVTNEQGGWENRCPLDHAT